MKAVSQWCTIQWGNQSF